jgi:hypothetical protein
MTTPTDSRSRRIRASRRGGHLLTRAQSPPNETGLPVHVCLKAPLSRTVAPYSPPRTQSAPDTVAGITRRLRPFIPDTNPLERFNREIARRTDVVGIFPDDASVIRLVSMLAIEANDEWLVGRSYISRGSMTTLYETRSALAPKTEEHKEVSELIAA